MRKYRAYLGLGSNMGDRAGFLRRAVEALAAHPRIRVVSESSIYETEPVGYEDQPDFLNSAVEIKTELSPRQLLEVTRGIENDLGRVRTLRWGPRVIDIDILHYEGVEESSEDLALPHPGILDRAFVLAPLSEIAPELELSDGRRAADAYAALSPEERAKVRLADC